jgi:DNA-binding transcriptional MerR regulator
MVCWVTFMWFALERTPALTVLVMTNAEPLPAETLTITEVAERTGLSPDTLRYYEKARLISPVGRSASGQRRYAAADLAWIEFLLRLRDTGMSIADMQKFAGLRRQGGTTVADRLALLRDHRARLADHIRQLQASGRALDDKISHYESLLEDA